MWKLLVAFILFAAAALFILKQAGGDIDMTGEKHGVDTSHGASAPAAAPASGPASAPVAAPSPASAASN
jgi:hypothetical protein